MAKKKTPTQKTLPSFTPPPVIAEEPADFYGKPLSSGSKASQQTPMTIEELRAVAGWLKSYGQELAAWANLFEAPKPANLALPVIMCETGYAAQSCEMLYRWYVQAFSRACSRWGGIINRSMGEMFRQVHSQNHSPLKEPPRIEAFAAGRAAYRRHMKIPEAGDIVPAKRLGRPPKAKTSVTLSPPAPTAEPPVAKTPTKKTQPKKP